jgi:hypothetical protein
VPPTLHVASVDAGQPSLAHIELVAGPSAPATFEVDGSETLGGLEPGTHLAVLSRNGSLRSERIVRIPGELNVDWSRRLKVQGRVLDAAGLGPVAGAEVTTGEWTTKSGVDGGFELLGVVAGEDVPVHVRASGLATQLSRVVVPVAEPGLHFRMRAGVEVRGRVEVPEAELVQARLYLLTSGDGGPGGFPFWLPGVYSDVRPGARGEFVLAGLPNARQPLPQIVRPRETPLVVGRVRDLRGWPIRGARLTTAAAGVRALWRGPRLDADVPWAPGTRALGATTTESAEDGSFSIGLPWPETWIHVAAPGHATQSKVIGRRSGVRVDFYLVPLDTLRHRARG